MDLGKHLKEVRDLRRQPFARLRDAASIAELGRVAEVAPLLGFNRQALRMRWLDWLYEETQCDCFLETGTARAHTTVSAHLLFRCSVRSVEIGDVKAAILRKIAAVGPTRQVRIVKGDSRPVLKTWLAELDPATRPLVYLDAHARRAAEHPLRDELSSCFDRGNCVVVIDDFKVDEDTGFGFDEYGGFTICLESIADLLDASRSTLFMPAHPASEETGYRRGTAAILIDVSLGEDAALAAFPGNLFKEIDL